MSNLYHFEMIFLIRVEILQNADNRTIKNMIRRINKFKEKVKEILDKYAIPTVAKVPIPGTQLVGYHEHPIETSNIVTEDEEVWKKCIDKNIYPIMISNRTTACSYVSFPKKIEDNFDKIKYKLQKYAAKLQLDGEFYAKVYKTERKYKGLIRGYQPTGIKILQTYTGKLKENV